VTSPTCPGRGGGATDPGRGDAAHRPDRPPGPGPGVLVSTIGAFRPGDALTTAPETLRLMLDVNLGPALWLSQAAAPHTQRLGSGAIVHAAACPGIDPSSARRPAA
jgi:NAD(P)-dependent dehydrogenase (short-subunit alcohol dehydrogenase family)